MTIDTSQPLDRCACGCGRRFSPKEGKRFAVKECRMLWHRAHTRKILDKRPRGTRAHRGAEFQLESIHLDILDRFAERVESRDRSEALRLLLERTQDAPERIVAAWHGLDEGRPRSEVMEDLAAIAAWVGGQH